MISFVDGSNIKLVKESFESNQIKWLIIGDEDSGALTFFIFGPAIFKIWHLSAVYSFVRILSMRDLMI